MRETVCETILVKHVKRSRKAREAHKRMQSFRRVEEEIASGPSPKVREVALLLLGVEMKEPSPGEVKAPISQPGRLRNLRGVDAPGRRNAEQRDTCNVEAYTHTAESQQPS